MEKHPQITLDRIRRFVEELKTQLWADARPLRASVYQCADPIPHDVAIRQSYTPVATGFAWGPVWSTAWFYLEGAIPPEWAGQPVALLIDTGSEALVWENGAPAQGLDANRQDYLLTQSAHGGETIDFFVEAAGNNLWGIAEMAGPSPFIFKQAQIACFNPQIWQLYHDVRVLFELVTELPADSSRRAQLLFTVNEALNAYRQGGEEAIVAARTCCAEAYAAPACASAPDVTAIGHSHIDVAWLWPLRETKRKCSRTFSTVLKYMEEYPEYKFLQSQPQLYAYVKELYPALYARIKQAVADGRWEPQGAMWVEADCNIISGESMVRQILHGLRFFRDEFGVENNVLWLPDVFGYSAAMPQILQGFGIPYFMTQKISWNQFNQFPHHTFYWEGIDGTRVLSHFLPANNYNSDFRVKEMLFGERNFKEKDRANSWLYVYGHGDGGGGPVRQMLESCRRMENVEGLPRVKQGFARDWFPAMEAAARDLRTWVGELYLEYHRGTYTTQAKNKWENRRCEFLLRDAEFLAAMIAEGGEEYPTQPLDEAWKLVLLNQFHDIIPGSSIGWVYEDSAKDYARVHEIGEGIRDNALSNFAAQIDTSDRQCPLLIWNTLSFVRGGLVSIPWEGQEPMMGVAPRGQLTRTQLTEADGRRRLLVEVVDTPSMGYSVVDLRPLDPTVETAISDEVSASERVLENSLVRVELDDFGGIISYYDKQNDRELIAEGQTGNKFHCFDDRPVNYDAWDIDPFYDEVEFAIDAPALITLIEKGPLRATIRVERDLTAHAHLVQLIRLEANSRRVDFETFIDWQETHRLLKVAFPVDIRSPRATYEIQYGHVERPTHRNTSWDVARFEVPAHKWADISEGDYGVALLNDGKYGYDIHGNVMRLSLLRSPKEPDPNADMGAHHFTYSILPHRGEVVNSGVPLAGYDLNVPLIAQQLPVQEGGLALKHSFLHLDKPNLIIEAVKKAEDGDGIIVRLYEAFRRRGSAKLITNGLCSRVTRTDLRERDQQELKVKGGAVTIPFRPFEIITLRLR